MKRFKSAIVMLLFVVGVSVYAGKPSLNLPTSWTVFGPIPAKDKLLDCSQMKSVPSELTINNNIYKGVTVKSESDVFDFNKIFFAGKKFDSKVTGSSAYLFSTLTVSEPVTMEIGAAADWWMAWYVDGKQVYSTLDDGNKTGNYSVLNHQFKVKLSKGKHTICVVVKSGSRGWKLWALGGDKLAIRKPLEQLRLAELKKKEQEERRKKWAEIRKKYHKNRVLKLAIYGSSVAWGSGAKRSYGWAANLKDLLEKTGRWQVVNKSIGGDTTVKLIARFYTDLLPEKPDMVMIGLSLSNEGIKGKQPERIYRQYQRNMRRLIQLCHKHNIVPIVTNCYPHNSYTPKQYQFIKTFNAELDRWHVASINFLGTVDDGNGKWINGSWNDGGHPNTVGHKEMFYAVPPSLFDYLIDQNYNLNAPGHGWLKVLRGNIKPTLSYQPEYDIHSFTAAFDLLIPEQPLHDSAIAQIGNSTLKVSIDGTISYTSASGTIKSSGSTFAVGRRNHIAVTYNYLKKQTSLYLNGVLVKSIKEDLTPTNFTLGGTPELTSCTSLFRNYLLYRSCLRQDQIQSLKAGNVLHSSLELYSPLTDSDPGSKIWLINLAPTEAMFKVDAPCKHWSMD